MSDEVTTRTTIGEPRAITGRERRQDERQWEALRAMVRTAGHGGHDWRGVGVPPLGDHLVSHLFICQPCDEVMFVTKWCNRYPCPECFPEGVWERLVAWWKHRRNGRE